jgi:negative regulator of flagellin synthesis FlgM
MTTKIEGMPPGMPRPSSSAGSAGGSAAPRAGERGRVASGDSVQLSGEAAGLASLERKMAESPGYDAAKVAAVRAMLDSGSYRVDPQEIAARLTQLERALGV